MTSSASPASVPHRLCKPEITEISFIPKIGNSAARSNGANQAIGYKTSSNTFKTGKARRISRSSSLQASSLWRKYLRGFGGRAPIGAKGDAPPI